MNPNRDQNEYLDRWEVRSVSVQPGTKGDKKHLDDILAGGWEPFAVTWDGSVFDYHLRRYYFVETEPE